MEKLLHLIWKPWKHTKLAIGKEKDCQCEKHTDSEICCCSVAESCPTLCNPVNCSTPGFLVLHYLRVCSSICLLNWRCHPTISFSFTPFSSCPQSFPASGSFPVSQLNPSGGQILELQHQSFQWIFRVDLLYDWLILYPCNLRDSQESSPAPQFESFISLMLSLLNGPTLTSAHDYWKNHSFDYMDLCWQSFPSKEQESFNLVAAVTICSELEPKKIKSCHCFHFSSFYLPWSDGARSHDISFFECWFLSQFRSPLSPSLRGS